MSKKNAKYKFDSNLISASHNKELDIAKKEWKVLCEETRYTQDGQCICQRKVKHVIYMFNIKNQNTIIVGSKCHKKFDMDHGKVNEHLSNVINKSLVKGEYEVIDNIVKYSKSIKEQLVQYFEKKIHEIIENYEDNKKWEQGFKISEDEYVPNSLKVLSRNIEYLIKEYQIEYLQDIYSSLCSKINEIYKERKQYEKRKDYCLKAYILNYMPGDGYDEYIYEYFFTSLEECYDYISKCPKVGVTVYSAPGCYWSHEDTYQKFDILYRDNLVKTIS
jgi:hypothetical protein